MHSYASYPLARTCPKSWIGDSALSPSADSTSSENGNTSSSGTLYLGSMATMQDLDLRAHTESPTWCRCSRFRGCRTSTTTQDLRATRLKSRTALLRRCSRILRRPATMFAPRWVAGTTSWSTANRCAGSFCLVWSLATADGSCVPGCVAQRVHRHSVPHPRALEDLRHRL